MPEERAHDPVGRPVAAEPTAHVLIVEDEESLADSVRYNLEREGFRVTVATDGRRAIDRFRTERPSLVILDLMLPEISGLDVCRTIRAETDVPIIMVTAKDSEADKVTGLELGADDYVTKPFSVRELVSRVRAHLRRARMRGRASARRRRAARGSGRDGRRPPRGAGAGRERRLPAEGVRAAGGVPPPEGPVADPGVPDRGGLGADYVGDTKTLDVHVKRIRQKIEADPHDPRHLVTVRGLGYKFLD